MVEGQGNFCLVCHNAVGTFHSFIYGFETVEEAEAYRLRWGHTGCTNSPIIAVANCTAIQRINDRHSPEAQAMYLVSEGRRQELEENWYDWMADHP